MKIAKELGQLLFTGIEGVTLKPDEQKFIVENNIGGVILFKRNIESPEQVFSLTQKINSLRNLQEDKLPLWISVDMEGGRVARLREPFTVWPPLASLGKIDSATVAFHFAHAMGLEIAAAGFNLNFAPCVDVLTNPANQVIGDRALSTQSESVKKLGSALVRGYLKAQIIPCAKHYPGHGNTLLDSHEELPVENRSLNELEALELDIYQKMIRARVPMILTAHIRFPKIDNDWPATLSPFFLKKILREKMRYRGLIVTDDMEMKALTKHYPDEIVPIQALQAGQQVLLYCHSYQKPEAAIDHVLKAVAENKLDKNIIHENYKAILDHKKKYLAVEKKQSMRELLDILNNPHARELSQAIKNGSVPSSLLREEDGDE